MFPVQSGDCFGDGGAASMDSSGDFSEDDGLDILVDGCKQGRTLSVAASLIGMSKKRREEVLTTKTTDESGQLFTPFLLSVRHGHLPLARLLLTMFSINPNDNCHIGSLSFDGYLVEGATPLWCAAAIGNFDLVKILIEHEAEINVTTSTNSSPLRAACFCGDLQIVQYLVERGADMEVANLFSNTSLMVASYRGNLQIVEYLLDKGAVVNALDDSNCTALHFAVDGSQLDVVKELVQKGADINIVNKNGLTPPLTAADNCNADMVDFFCSLDSMTVLEKINALELLGASFANDKDHYDLEKTYHFFYLTLLMREKDNIPKVACPPVPAYLNRKECETKEELRVIRNDCDAIHMESLIARERILGPDNIEIPHPITYRGAVYADRLEFSRSISLWQRAMDLKQKNGREIYCDLFRFAEVYSQMVLMREEIDVNALAAVLESCLQELTKTRLKLEEAKKFLPQSSTASEEPRSSVIHKCPHVKLTPEETAKVVESQLEGNIHVMLYLLLIVTKTTRSRAESYLCGKIIYRFVKSDFRDSHGRTPLHLVLDESTPVDDFHVKDVCSFPNSDISKLLLSCGANPNARSNDGNTPLHLIVQYAKPISDFMTLHTAIVDLLEAGAHPDIRNYMKLTPLELATTGVAEIILKKESSWSLKCFAARVIQKHSIPYRGHVPVSLEKFIEMH